MRQVMMVRVRDPGGEIERGWRPRGGGEGEGDRERRVRSIEDGKQQKEGAFI